MRLDALLEDRFEGRGQHRQLRPFQSYGPRHLIDDQGRRVLNFASNDYLGLSELCTSSEIRSQPSSRLLAGNTRRHLELEDLLADFLGRAASLTYPSGYTANLGVLSCLPQKGDTIIMDRLSHASLLDGARLSGARIERFHHQDLNHLEELLKRHEKKSSQIWVVSEGLFSMDGDLCPIREMVELKDRFGALLILDEAHSIGIYGKEGRGWAHQQESLERVDILTFNLSKAFALQGGVVSGSKKLKETLIQNSRQQIYTTATPLSHLEALPERLETIRKSDAKREHLAKLCEQLAQTLSLEGHTAPILPYHLEGSDRALSIAEDLWDQAIFCPAILPPTVPPNSSRLRISLNALHQREDLSTLSQALIQFRAGAPLDSHQRS